MGMLIGAYVEDTMSWHIGVHIDCYTSGLLASIYKDYYGQPDGCLNTQHYATVISIYIDK